MKKKKKEKKKKTLCQFLGSFQPQPQDENNSIFCSFNFRIIRTSHTDYYLNDKPRKKTRFIPTVNIYSTQASHSKFHLSNYLIHLCSRLSSAYHSNPSNLTRREKSKTQIMKPPRGGQRSVQWWSVGIWTKSETLKACTTLRCSNQPPETCFRVSAFGPKSEGKNCTWPRRSAAKHIHIRPAECAFSTRRVLSLLCLCASIPIIRPKFYVCWYTELISPCSMWMTTLATDRRRRVA